MSKKTQLKIIVTVLRFIVVILALLSFVSICNMVEAPTLKISAVCAVIGSVAGFISYEVLLLSCWFESLK